MLFPESAWASLQNDTNYKREDCKTFKGEVETAFAKKKGLLRNWKKYSFKNAWSKFDGYHRRKKSKKDPWPRASAQLVIVILTCFKLFFSGFETYRQRATYLVFATVFWMAVMVITNYLSLLGSRIEPSYLTLVCQAGYKTCTRMTSSDFCSHQLYKCTSTRVFEQPEEFVLPERADPSPPPFTKKDNEVNLRRCKKKNLYAMVLDF